MLKEKNAEIHREILDLTQELIRIPSTHLRPGEIGLCADFIEEWLNQHDIDSMRFEETGIPSLAVLPATSGAKVLLVTHFDVVEPGNEILFKPSIANGRLYGRGAIDDKYAVALSLILFREQLKDLQKNGKSQADMPFGLLLSGDEEIGGTNGVAKLVDKITTDFFLVLDGGNPDLIVTREKGIIQLFLEAQGTAAHAARPWLGQNGFDILVQDYLKLKELFCDKAPDHWHKTMVLTQCQAGSGSTNMVPERATATVDIRYTEEEDPDAIIRSIKEVVSCHVAVQAKEPLFCSKPSPYLDLLLRHSGNGVLGSEHGASDARYFSEKGFCGAIWGADGELSQHSEEEHVVIQSVYQLYDSLQAFLEEHAIAQHPNGWAAHPCRN